MGNYSIRKASPEDALPILQVQREAWLSDYVNDELGISKRLISKLMVLSPQRIERMRNQILSEYHPIWVAKLDGVVVGYCAPNVDELGRNRVGGLFVLEDHQRKTIGSQLMRYIIEHHKGNGDIFLEVPEYNQKAIEFYKSHGFKVLDKQTSFEITEGVNMPLVTMHRKEV